MSFWKREREREREKEKKRRRKIFSVTNSVIDNFPISGGGGGTKKNSTRVFRGGGGGTKTKPIATTRKPLKKCSSSAREWCGIPSVRFISVLRDYRSWHCLAFLCVCVCVSNSAPTQYFYRAKPSDSTAKVARLSLARGESKKNPLEAPTVTHTRRERERERERKKEGRPSMANAPLNPPAETNLLRTGIVALETGEIGYAAAAGSSGPGPSSASSRAGTSQPAIWRLAPAASCPSQELRRTDNYGAIRSKNCRNDDCSCHIETYRY